MVNTSQKTRRNNMNELTTQPNNVLFPGAELNFYTFENLALKKMDLTKIHFISSIIQNSEFNKVKFYNASILSTKFINVNFLDCDLSSTDICSVWINNGVFKNADFNDSNITDSTFINCKFDNSTFNSVSLLNCQFINCTFETMPISDSTFSLNTFEKCKIKNTEFTESFYYQVFKDCEFYSVNMDPKLLGYNFGFSKQVLKKLAGKNNLNEVEEDFISKGLYINAAILKVNQVQEDYDIAMLACFSALSQMVQNNILIKADEIVFLRTLTKQLDNENKISPFCIIQIWQILSNLKNNIESNTAIEKSANHIQEFINMIYFDFQYFLQELQLKINSLSISSSLTGIGELKIVYKEKPNFEIITCLSTITHLISPNCPEPVFIKSEKGSYIEFHRISLEIIPYIQTILSLLGVIVPIVVYKKEKKDRKKETEKQKDTNPTNCYVEIQTLPEVPTKTILLPTSVIIDPQTNILVSNSINVINEQKFSTSANYGGYNSRNIQSVTIKFQ